MRLSKNDLVGGDQASCMLEARMANSFMNMFMRFPWATADQQQLEGRSAFVECVQPGKGPALTTAAGASACAGTQRLHEHRGGVVR